MLLLAALVALRRLTEKEARIGPPGSGQRDTVVDGVRWRSREVGAPGPEGTTVVYVHGFFSSSSTWKRVIASASGGRPAIAVDLPGAGFSDRPSSYDYTVFGQASRLLRYLEARGVSRVVLVGNSLGGAVCEAAAAAQSDGVRVKIVGLVLVDAAGPSTSIPLGFRSLRTPVLGEIQLELAARPVIAYALRRRLYASSERVTEETVDDWWLPITVPGTRRAALASVRTSRRGTESLLEKISAPTLVVWGASDSLLPPPDGLALSTSIRGARFVLLPDAGHLPQEETPETFARVVAPFVREVDGEKP